MSSKRYLSEIDNLPVRASGFWIKRKHYYLQEYAKIFTTGMSNKWSGRLTFLDLFAGPGRCLIDQSGLEVDGSPLLALQYGFNKYIFVEETEALFKALKVRCSNSPKLGAIEFVQEDCNKGIENIIKLLPSGNLNLAFIDPTDIDIHFETVKKLSLLPNGVDLLMNIQYGMDIKRNFKLYCDQGESSKLARFLGKDFDLSQLKEDQDVIEAYKFQISKLGYKTVEFRDITIKNSNNAELYFLLFASKHERGIDFWTKISKKDEQGQGELF